jgi:hypothetical protein
MAAKELIPAQQALIQTLYLHTNIVSQAAAKIGVNPRVALAWMQRPYKKEAFLQARRAAITKLIAEAKSGKIDAAMGAAAMVEQDATALETSVAVVEKFSAQDADVQAKTLQQWISELQASLTLSIDQCIEWR